MARALRDRYGFLFWLRWILAFAGSFLAAAALWTAGLRAFFGPIHGGELTFTWIVAVFGSWFILLTPFMRKKEQIWKRLNDDQEKAVDAWLGGLCVFVGLLMASCVFWDFYFKDRVLGDPSLDPEWGKAVLASWLLLTLPFLAVLYRQADRIFKDAASRQTGTSRYRQHWIEPARRRIPDAMTAKLRKCQPTLPGGHLVTLILRGGRRVEHVFIRHGNEIAGIYDRPALDFETSDIEDIRVVSLQTLPVFEEARWCRFDVPSE